MPEKYKSHALDAGMKQKPCRKTKTKAMLLIVVLTENR